MAARLAVHKVEVFHFPQIESLARCGAVTQGHLLFADESSKMSLPRVLATLVMPATDAAAIVLSH